MVSLRKLRLRGCPIGSSGAARVMHALASGRGSVRSVDLSNTGMTGGGASAVCGFLSICPSVEMLNLEQNDLGASAGSAIGALFATARSSSLRVVGLAHCGLGNDGVVGILRPMLGDGGGERGGAGVLREFEGGDTTGGPSARVELMDLSGNGMGERGARAVASVLASPTCPLKELILAENSIGKAILDIASALANPAASPNLAFLDLSQTSPPPRAIPAIKEVVALRNTQPSAAISLTVDLPPEEEGGGGGGGGGGEGGGIGGIGGGERTHGVEESVATYAAPISTTPPITTSAPTSPRAKEAEELRRRLEEAERRIAALSERKETPTEENTVQREETKGSDTVVGTERGKGAEVEEIVEEEEERGIEAKEGERDREGEEEGVMEEEDGGSGEEREEEVEGGGEGGKEVEDEVKDEVKEEVEQEAPPASPFSAPPNPHSTHPPLTPPPSATGFPSALGGGGEEGRGGEGKSEKFVDEEERGRMRTGLGEGRMTVEERLENLEADNHSLRNVVAVLLERIEVAEAAAEERQEAHQADVEALANAVQGMASKIEELESALMEEQESSVRAIELLLLQVKQQRPTTE